MEVSDALIDEFLHAYCNRNETDVTGCKRSDGFTMEHSDDVKIPSGFKEVYSWADKQFRTVWVNGPDLSSITYCEGDIIVIQHATQESYDEDMANAEEYYKTH